MPTDKEKFRADNKLKWAKQNVVHWRREWQTTSVFLAGNSTDRGDWQATVRGIAKSRT